MSEIWNGNQEYANKCWLFAYKNKCENFNFQICSNKDSN